MGVGDDVDVGRNMALVVYGESRASTKPLVGLPDNADHALFERVKVGRGYGMARQHEEKKD